MRYSGTWLTPEDESILEALETAGPASPPELAERPGTPNSGLDIAERCSTLAGRGGLVSFEHGRYRLARKGVAYLAGELDPRELGSGGRR